MVPHIANEETNISLLLDVIKDLSKQGIEDSNPILPVLIDISGLACEILCLLQPKRLLGFNWAPFAKQDKLKAAFEALDKKRKLLHLHMSHANNSALSALQEAFHKQQDGTSLALQHPMAPPITATSV